MSALIVRCCLKSLLYSATHMQVCDVIHLDARKEGTRKKREEGAFGAWTPRGTRGDVTRYAFVLISCYTEQPPYTNIQINRRTDGAQFIREWIAGTSVRVFIKTSLSLNCAGSVNVERNSRQCHLVRVCADILLHRAAISYTHIQINHRICVRSTASIEIWLHELHLNRRCSAHQGIVGTSVRIFMKPSRSLNCIGAWTARRTWSDIARDAFAVILHKEVVQTYRKTRVWNTINWKVLSTAVNEFFGRLVRTFTSKNRMHTCRWIALFHVSII